MDEDQSRRYESIDALIKAAEVLERNEFNSKNQMTTKDKDKLSNNTAQRHNVSYQQSNSKLKCSKARHLNGQSKERFSDNLFQTIKCINELRSDEHWYSLIENKLKSDNRALYQELNNLKRKLNKVKNMTCGTKKFKSIDISYEDEDTSTASEDEDYNKYDSKIMDDNLDDATDDASECEEIKQFSHRNKIYKMKHIASNQIVRSNRNFSDNHSNSNRVSLLKVHRRRHRTPGCHSPDLLQINHPFALKQSTMTLPHSIWNNCNMHNRQCTRSIPISQNGLISTSNREVSSKVHRIA